MHILFPVQQGVNVRESDIPSQEEKHKAAKSTAPLVKPGGQAQGPHPTTPPPLVPTDQLQKIWCESVAFSFRTYLR